jgi:hypothetical protein
LTDGTDGGMKEGQEEIVYLQKTRKSWTNFNGTKAEEFLEQRKIAAEQETIRRDRQEKRLNQ